MMYPYDDVGYERSGADEPAEAGLPGTDQLHGHRGAPIDPHCAHSRGRTHPAPNCRAAHPPTDVSAEADRNTDRSKRRDVLTSR